MKDIIHNLFEKYLSGTISDQELKELLSHFDAREINDDLLKQIRNTLESHDEIIQEDIAVAEEVRNRLSAQLNIPKTRLLRLSPFTAVAAAVLILAISVSMFFLLKRENKIQPPEITVLDSVVPGSGKAVLLLSDGSKFLLNDSSSSEIKDKSGRLLAQSESGVLNYVHNNRADLNRNAFNTVVVPNGGSFKIVLPDGSIAYLNAGSTLRYPEDFGTNSRKIELKGEGYFEVVKNKKLPFTVKSANMEVTALGTQFNVNTYSDEPFGAATLVEGSLRVQDIRSQKAVILSPGEQAISAYGELKVQAVHTEDKMAWKDGLFVVDRANLAEVMRQVERWYDVKIVGVVPTKKITVSGEFPRSISIEELLNSLERTTGVKFKIQGRRIEIR